LELEKQIELIELESEKKISELIDSITKQTEKYSQSLEIYETSLSKLQEQVENTVAVNKILYATIDQLKGDIDEKEKLQKCLREENSEYHFQILQLQAEIKKEKENSSANLSLKKEMELLYVKCEDYSNQTKLMENELCKKTSQCNMLQTKLNDTLYKLTFMRDIEIEKSNHFTANDSEIFHNNNDTNFINQNGGEV
jgi:chromosome segregation ATPase